MTLIVIGALCLCGWQSQGCLETEGWGTHIESCFLVIWVQAHPPLPPECWDYMSMWSHLAYLSILRCVSWSVFLMFVFWVDVTHTCALKHLCIMVIFKCHLLYSVFITQKRSYPLSFYFNFIPSYNCTYLKEPNICAIFLMKNKNPLWSF
jgi:hypothetical protein